MSTRVLDDPSPCPMLSSLPRLPFAPCALKFPTFFNFNFHPPHMILSVSVGHRLHPFLRGRGGGRSSGSSPTGLVMELTGYRLIGSFKCWVRASACEDAAAVCGSVSLSFRRRVLVGKVCPRGKGDPHRLCLLNSHLL